MLLPAAVRPISWKTGSAAAGGQLQPQVEVQLQVIQNQAEAIGVPPGQLLQLPERS